MSSLTLWSCNEQQTKQSGVTLTGKVNFPEDGSVLLEEYGDKDVTVIDTIAVTSAGDFQYSTSLDEPGFYRLNFYGKQMVNLIIYRDDLNIEVAGNDANGAVTITGSKDMEYLTDINRMVQDFQQGVSAMNQQYVQANSNGDQAEMDRIRSQFEVKNKQYKDQLKQKVSAMGNSLAVLQIIGNFNAEEDYEFLNNLGKVFANDPPDSKHTPRFLTYIESVQQQYKNSEKLQVGKLAPDINLPNPDGTVVPLSSLRGKVVLVDFWAQWCRPCRMENPNIVDAYGKFKDKGFEVYGVSLDRTREKWLQGIEEDGLTWTHVSDLKYWQSEAAQTYNINAIPASFLLDREGKIIAKNLRGQSLHQKLKEILG
jgi:peroxiredoxin